MAAKKGKAKSRAKPRSKAKATLIPAVRYLRYHLTNSATPGTETSHYIDLARDISRVNRRLYRQGRDYHVKKITIVTSNTPNGGNRISASVMPDTWVTRNAWKRGFQTWTQMNKTATSQTSGDISGTWADFKVRITDSMRTGTILEPLDNGSTAYAAGEWEYSSLVSPDETTGADEFELHMLGDHEPAGGPLWTSVGLIKSYGESRATVSYGPSVPGDASDDPLVNVFDFGTTIDEVVQNLETDNDIPPYDRDSYPGDDGNGPKPVVAQDTTIVDGRAMMSGFNVLCGLIELESTSPLPNDVYSVLIELASGKYRGIKSEAI